MQAIREIKCAQSVMVTNNSDQYLRIGEKGVRSITYIPAESKYIIIAAVGLRESEIFFETWVHASNVQFARPMKFTQKEEAPPVKSPEPKAPADPMEIPSHLATIAKVIDQNPIYEGEATNEPTLGKARRGRAPKAK